MKQKKISEGLLLALCPFLAYLYTFSFEAGYVSHFKIPLNFISLNLTNIFVFGGSVLVTLASSFWFFWFLNWLFIFIPKKKLKSPVAVILARAFFRILAVAFLLGLIFILLKIPFREWIKTLLYATSAYAGMMFFVELVLPRLFAPKKASYAEQLKAYDELDKDESASTFGEFISRASSGTTSIITLALTMVLLPYLAGAGVARTQKEFLILGSSQKIVLRIYNDKLITAPFDTKSKAVEPLFTIENLANEQELKLENVGPLRLKSTTDPENIKKNTKMTDTSIKEIPNAT